VTSKCVARKRKRSTPIRQSGLKCSRLSLGNVKKAKTLETKTETNTYLSLSLSEGNVREAQSSLRTNGKQGAPEPQSKNDLTESRDLSQKLYEEKGKDTTSELKKLPFVENAEKPPTADAKALSETSPSYSDIVRSPTGTFKRGMSKTKPTP
jgi:hypothetical protein